MENSRQHLLLRTDILQKIVVGCPCEMMIFYLNYQLSTAHRSVGLQFLLWKALDVYNPKAGQDKYQNLNSRKRGFHSHPSGGEQRTGYPFQRRFLERGVIFRTHESATFVSSHLKVFKDKLLLKIRFNALTSKLLYSCCTLERSIKNWPIFRTGYQF